MTEMPSLPPTPDPSASPRTGSPRRTWPPLVRSRDDRVLAGVCAAVARSSGTDPVLWRVVLGVLTVFGGSGLLVYAAGYLLIPLEGQPESVAERALRSRGRDMSVLAVVAAVVVALGLGVAVGDGFGLLPLLVVGTLAFLVWRSKGEAAGRRPTSQTYGPTA